jgi:hypothetical protein
MQRRVGDEWQTVMPPALEYLDGVPTDSKLATPELWGCFGRIRENELKTYECLHNKITMHIDGVINCDDENPRGYNATVTSQLVSTAPCKAVFILSENVTASEKNNHSCYGTDSDDPFKGENPIIHLSMRYGPNNYKFKDLEIDHFTGPMAISHALSGPSRPGIVMFPNAYNIWAIGIDVGVAYSPLMTTLTGKLVDPDRRDGGLFLPTKTTGTPVSSSSSSSSSFGGNEAPVYHLRVRLLVTRELILEWKNRFYLGVF